MHRLALFAALILLEACGSLLGNDRAEEPAALVTDAGLLRGKATVTFSADTAAAGAPVTIAISTAGGGCLRKGRTLAVQHGRVLELRPYTTRPTARDVVCPADFRIERHVVTRSFSAPGAYIVRAIGAKGKSVERPLVVHAP